jgi:hypothetical protein
MNGDNVYQTYLSMTRFIKVYVKSTTKAYLTVLTGILSTWLRKYITVRKVSRALLAATFQHALRPIIFQFNAS